jgi:CDP-diacylglycerol--glycerol-3-phosphate 3-phosphatidyltransferase
MGDVSARLPAAQSRTLAVLPGGVLNGVIFCLDRVALGLVALGVTANGITIFSVVLAAAAGGLLAFGYFGVAAVAMVIASLGDALDGLVARRTGTASVGGALLDASVDRYEEFFFLGGLAVYFRGLPFMLVLTLFALAGSFMVSYGSAKAEALNLPVPPSSMRRAERAVCLCLGAILTPPFQWLAHANGGLPDWVERLPLLSAVALIAVVANVSAVRRLRWLARSRPVDASASASREATVAPRPTHEERDEVDDSGHSHGARVVAAPHALRSP